MTRRRVGKPSLCTWVYRYVARMRNVSSPDVQTRVNTTLSRVGASNLDQEHGLLESWLGEELSGVTDSSGGRNDLSTTSVDGIGVESTVQDVESDTSHWLLSHGTFSGCPLECSDT